MKVNVDIIFVSEYEDYFSGFHCREGFTSIGSGAPSKLDALDAALEAFIHTCGSRFVDEITEVKYIGFGLNKNNFSSWAEFDDYLCEVARAEFKDNSVIEGKCWFVTILIQKEKEDER